MRNKSESDLWLDFAESDLELARKGNISRKVKIEMLCFHAQQAAEKAIKAVLVFNSIEFPWKHDIEYLFKLVKANGIEIPKPVKEAQFLSQYAVAARYPGNELDLNKADLKEAIEHAAIVLKWAKKLIKENP